jgi:hypothetical protein
MAGKLCTGATTNNAYNPDASKAFSEGMYHRAQGTAAAYPITDNPHDGTGSEDETAWDAGWNVANSAAPGAISQTDAPCVAIPLGNIAS